MVPTIDAPEEFSSLGSPRGTRLLAAGLVLIDSEIVWARPLTVNAKSRERRRRIKREGVEGHMSKTPWFGMEGPCRVCNRPHGGLIRSGSNDTGERSWKRNKIGRVEVRARRFTMVQAWCQAEG